MLFAIWPGGPKCLDHQDLILCDVKISDPDQHRRVTGVNNDIILHILTRLLAVRPEDVIARIPLLPYHPYGLSKAERIGRKQAGSLPEKLMARSKLLQWQCFFVDLKMIDP